MTLRRRVAEKMGYKVVEANEFMGAPDGCKPAFVLLDPKGKLVGGWFKTPKACWENVPTFDTWACVGLVLKWLGERDYYFEIYYQPREDEPWRIRDDTYEFHNCCFEKSSKTVDDFPEAICEFALEVVKE